MSIPPQLVRLLPECPRAVLSATLFFVTASAAVAQVAPEDRAAETTVRLSPFEVTADGDAGYVATQTLAGTRLASSIRDVAAQVTVMTPEFLQDVGAATLEESQLYSLNVENSQELANDPRGDGAGGVEYLTSQQRVRGLGTADNTRDFFTTFFALDSYNSERFTFSSGPNAILFGLGTPAGIIDTSLKRARFADFNQVIARVDNYDSYRLSFDVNREVIDGTLAVRAVALYDDAQFWRKPSGDRQRRQFITGTYRPFRSTTVRLAYENVRREAARPRNTLIKDAVTPYLGWRSARMKELGITDPRDPRLYYAGPAFLNPGEVPFAVGAGTPFVGTNGSVIYLLTGELAPDTPGAALLNRMNGSVVSRGPESDVPAPDNFPYSLRDPSLFPHDINVGGFGTLNRQRGSIFTAFFEQQVTRNFSLEAAFNREVYRQDYVDWVRGTDQALRIDVNRYIPNVFDAVGNPVLNPNRGRYYVESWSRGSYTQGDADSARLTASYKLDFGSRAGWSRWLGSHNLAGLLDYNRTSVAMQNHRGLLYSDSADVNLFNPNDRFSRRVFHRVYLDTPGTDGTSHYDPPRHVTGLANEIHGAYQDVRVQLRADPLDQGVWAPGSVTETEINGSMVATQSHFWNDRIVATYGRRWDDFKSKRVVTSQVAPGLPPGQRPWYWNNLRDVSLLDGPDLDNDPDLTESGYQDTRGLVVFPHRLFSLHYNESSNRRPGSPGYSPNGGFYEPSSGDGRDYGFGLQLLGGRLFAKVNWYETAQTNNSSVEFGALKFNVAGLEHDLRILGERNPQSGYRPSTTFDPELGPQVTPVLADFASEGVEITLTANPTPNWRLWFTAAKTRSVETNIAQEWRTYVDGRMPEWRKLWDEARDLNQASGPGVQTVGEWVEQEVFFRLLDRARLLEGRPSDRVREWRVNLATNYELREGRLRGLGVGGAFRWRDEASIGLPLIDGPDGNRIQDVNNPFYDDGLTDLDAWVSYRLKLFDDRVDARFQVNVRNVLDRQKLIPQAATSLGERRLFTAQTPRQIIFTTTFDF